MNIQQNLNQTLSLASFIYSQTPQAAAYREEVADKKARDLASKEAKKATSTAEIAAKSLTEKEAESSTESKEPDSKKKLESKLPEEERERLKKLAREDEAGYEATLADYDVEAFQTSQKKPRKGQELDAYAKTAIEFWHKAREKNLEAFSATQDPEYLKRAIAHEVQAGAEERKMKTREKDRARKAKASLDASMELERGRILGSTIIAPKTAEEWANRQGGKK